MWVNLVFGLERFGFDSGICVRDLYCILVWWHVSGWEVAEIGKLEHIWKWAKYDVTWMRRAEIG
jgi:hypothetical protein